MKPAVFGVLAQPLPSEVRQKLERNTGILAAIVTAESPAFNANILEGDVIVKINDEDINSVADFFQKIPKFAGQKVNIEIWRNGEFKTIPVQLNNKP